MVLLVPARAVVEPTNALVEKMVYGVQQSAIKKVLIVKIWDIDDSFFNSYSCYIMN